MRTNSSGALLSLWPNMAGGTPKMGFTSSLSSGDNTVYVVPTGKVAFVVEFGSRTTGTTTSFIPKFYDGSVSWACVTGANTGNLQGYVTGGPNTRIPRVMTAGQAFVLNVNTTGQSYGFYSVVEFEATDCPFRQLKVVLDADKALYTVPANTVALATFESHGSFSVQPGTSSSSNAPGVLGFNASGTNKTLSVYLVPSGESRGAQHLAGFNSVISTGSSSNLIVPFSGIMPAGTEIYIDIDTPNSSTIAVLSVYEQPV